MNTPFFPARYVGSMVRSEMRWHYTTGDCLQAIVNTSLILPATAYTKKYEKPVVWFSSNPVWEATACKGLVEPGRLLPRTATFVETLNLGHGLVRLGVDPQTAPYNFRALISRSGMPRRQARALVRVASEMGADPRDWWGTFVPVPHHLWTAVEVWQENHWEPLSTPRPQKVSP